MSHLSKIKSEVARAARPKKTKTILLDFEGRPDTWSWLEDQAAKANCSKTSFIMALIRISKGGGK